MKTRNELLRMTKGQLLRELTTYYKTHRSEAVTKSDDVINKMRKLVTNWNQEHVVLMSLDGANKVIDVDVVFKGTTNRCVFAIRDVMAMALRNYATSIIVAHNHPSGNLKMSGEDNVLRHKLREACKLMEVTCLDFIIFSEDDHQSY